MPCLNNGVCGTDGIEFFCTCPPDTTGKTCEKEVNPCLSGPCKNKGRCFKGGFFGISTFFYCICAAGFHGKYG